MSHDAANIKSRILTQLEAFCFYLLPAGKVIGPEFRVGDVNNAPGKSLAVALKGSSAGLWCDYASPTDKGDVFDLWCKVKGIEFRDAFPEICRWLGVSNIDRPKPKAKPPAPDTTGLSIDGRINAAVLAYLTETRGLSKDTLKTYQIRSHARPKMEDIRAYQDAKKAGEPAEWPASVPEFVGFQFFAPDGDPVMLKSTGIRPQSDGKKDTWTTSPWYTLWGWWTVKPSDRAIVITEGEYDAMSVHQMNPGIPVLSLPAGASNLTWIENDFDTLQRFEKIYICTDADEAGEKCAQEMAKRLGLARSYRIKPPSPYKDANQFLTECKDETLDVLQWFAAATSYDPPTLRGTGSFRDDVKARIKREKAEDAVNNFLFPEVPFQVRPGECTLLTGYTGHGKSELTYQILVHEMGNGEKTVIASYEIDPAEMLCNISTQLIGHKPETDEEVDRAMDWLDGRLWFVSPKDSDDDKLPSSAELFSDFDYAVNRFGCTRVAIDSLMFLVGKDDYDAQDALAKACRTFCRKKHPTTHVFLLAHSAIKIGEDKLPTASAIQGSTGILAPFNNIITVWRNVDKEEKMEKAEGDESKTAEVAKLHDGIIKWWKQRRNGKRPKLKVWFDGTSKRFRTKQDDTPPPTIETAKADQLPLTEDEPF